MTTPIPQNAERLIRHLRRAADELESAARYGVPIPDHISISGYPVTGGLGMSLTDHEFAAWVDYTDAQTAGEVKHHEPGNGVHVSIATVEVNGLPLCLSMVREVQRS